MNKHIKKIKLAAKPPEQGVRNIMSALLFADHMKVVNNSFFLSSLKNLSFYERFLCLNSCVLRYHLKQNGFNFFAITSAAVVIIAFISQNSTGAIEDYFINFRVRYDHLKSKKFHGNNLIDQVTAKTMGRLPILKTIKFAYFGFQK